MDKFQQAVRQLKEFAGKYGPRVFYEATVKAVDKTAFLADLETEEGFELFDCRLRALASGNKSMDVLPKVGSAVLIAKLAEDDYLVLACDVIDSYRVTVGPAFLEVTADGLKLNGDSLGGLVKINTLLDRLNRLEERMLTHQHLSAAPGSPTAPDPATNAPFAPTQKAELENRKVTHG